MDVWVDDFALRYHIGRDLNADPTTLPLISIPEWLDTYQDQFFPHLLQYVSDKQSLWMADWSKDEDGVRQFLADHGFVVTATQTETHLETNIIYIYRYDRLPTAPPLATYGSILALTRTQFPTQGLPGDALDVSLWWSVKADPGKDYSVSTFLLNAAGQLVVQHDGSPLDGKSPMHDWHTGDLRFDQAHLALPAALPPGSYELAVKVYWYADLKPLPVNGSGASSDGTYLVLGNVKIG